MNLQKFTTYKIIIGLTLAVLMIYFILIEVTTLSIVEFMVAIIFLTLLQNKTETTQIDERAYTITEKAARKTLQLFVLCAVVIGFLLVELKNFGYNDLSQAGTTLLYCASFLSILNLIFWYYYRREYGG